MLGIDDMSVGDFAIIRPHRRHMAGRQLRGAGLGLNYEEGCRGLYGGAGKF